MGGGTCVNSTGGAVQQLEQHPDLTTARALSRIVRCSSAQMFHSFELNSLFR